MATGPKNQKANQIVIGRLQEQIRQSSPDDERVKAGLLRIAMLISGKAKLNIRRQKMIDTGRLYNSLRWEFKKEGSVSSISIGSFGVIYAAMNEFGGEISEKQRRAMFAAMAKRRVTRPPKYPRVIESKSGKLYWRPRPYLTPAVLETQDEIVKIIASMVG